MRNAKLTIAASILCIALGACASTSTQNPSQGSTGTTDLTGSVNNNVTEPSLKHDPIAYTTLTNGTTTNANGVNNGIGTMPADQTTTVTTTNSAVTSGTVSYSNDTAASTSGSGSMTSSSSLSNDDDTTTATTSTRTRMRKD